MTIPDISPTILDLTGTVSVLQHPLYCCYHNNYGSYPTWHTYDIIHSLHDITITLYDIIPQYLWHHSHCIHDIRSPTYDITCKFYDISSPIPVTSQTLCFWIHINNIYHQTHGGETIQPLYLKSRPPYVYLCDHTVYPWYNTHGIDDMAPTIFMAQYALYLTSHPRFVTSQQSIHYSSLLYLISNWLYLTAHPLYLCHHTQIIDHITPIVYMITQAQYVRHHMNTYDIISTLYDITSHFDIYTHCIHVITPRIPVITSTVAELLLTVYSL